MMIVNIAGLALITLIIWWFWLYQPREIELTDNSLVIVVENGVYQPAHIKLPSHQASELQFLRRDPSPCSETVLFPSLDISESLTLNKSIKINLPPMEKGEYEFHCQMQMYRGLLKVD